MTAPCAAAAPRGSRGREVSAPRGPEAGTRRRPVAPEVGGPGRRGPVQGVPAPAVPSPAPAPSPAPSPEAVASDFRCRRTGRKGGVELPVRTAGVLMRGQRRPPAHEHGGRRGSWPEGVDLPSGLAFT
ncbi:hypothetical protein GCM10010269_43910 [Streptomyces humidus]|uniref:Uncharacterized protein n=1 Tax=Streptomyces humidus TaxID=52259 RepID=A0A918FZ96_9ACTN|nr:hypothetical protein GCM10010269_43910 [Streptomyces humidus]